MIEDLLNISKSSNVFMKVFRGGFKKAIQSLEEAKKGIKEEIKEGTDMEKKIRKISQTLKKSGMPLKKELQSELEAIGKQASTELSKVNTMKVENFIDNIKTKLTENHKEMIGKMETLSKLALDDFKNTQKKKEEKDKASAEVDDKLAELMKMMMKLGFNAYSDHKEIQDKLNKAYDAISKIRKGSIRAEQIEYYVLLSSKDSPHSKTDPQKDPETDAAFSTCFSLTQCAFTIMFGMLFCSLNPNAI